MKMNEIAFLCILVFPLLPTVDVYSSGDKVKSNYVAMLLTREMCFVYKDIIFSLKVKIKQVRLALGIRSFVHWKMWKRSQSNCKMLCHMWKANSAEKLMITSKFNFMFLNLSLFSLFLSNSRLIMVDTEVTWLVYETVLCFSFGNLPSWFCSAFYP